MIGINKFEKIKLNQNKNFNFQINLHKTLSFSHFLNSSKERIKIKNQKLKQTNKTNNQSIEIKKKTIFRKRIKNFNLIAAETIIIQMESQ